MKPRRGDYLACIAALGVLMAMSSAAFAQQARAVTPVSDYVKYLLQPTPEFEETWGQLTGLISDECAKVMKASPDELEKEKRWLNGITRDAKIRLERAFDRVEHLAHIHRTAGQAEIPQEAYNSIQSDLADARLEVAVTALINARVGECITTRGRTLGGEYWMTGSWQARCTAAPGVEPDTYGRLTLQLAGKTVRGTVFPGADSAGTEVSGPVGSYGSFKAESRANTERIVMVSGRIDSTPSLRGSGSIVVSGTVPGYGGWECIGTWTSD